MIGHISEVWLALFAAFAVGSLLGWLVYRWVDRSDYAFDQRELTDAVGRRLRGEQRAPSLTAPTLAELQAAPKERPMRSARSRTAEKFRARVRGSSLAAAWRATRDGTETPAPKPEPRQAASAPIAAPTPAPANRVAPASVTRTAPARPVANPAGPATAGDPWPLSSDPWPVPAAAWPTANGARRSTQALLPPPTPSGAPAHLFGQRPVHDEIWASDDVFVVDSRGSAAKRPSGPRRGEKPPALTNRPPVLSAPPQTPDNLQLIKGIGPAFERKLFQLGIYRYRQIAAWTQPQRDWIAQELTAPRIEKDRWIEQAAVLALGRGAKAAAGD